MKQRPELREVPLADWVWVVGEPYPVGMVINEGAWNDYIRKSYQQGTVLIEISDQNKPVRAFKKE